MTARKLNTTAFLLLLACLPSLGQVSNRDLEGLERHRKPQKAVSVLQSIEDADSSAFAWTVPQMGTWDFLDEEEKADDETPAPGIPSGEGNARQARPALPLEASLLQQRLLALPQELMIPYNEYLEGQIANYVIRHAGALKGILGKYYYWEENFRSAFRAQGIPEELATLAIVESAMNPLATSPAGARGAWQFMPETARAYGLRCDWSVDERLDMAVSAKAAARYLKAAYKRFGDWALAVSSYNCGPVNVESAIQKAGSREFWDIYPYLPDETKGYMPAFVAALYSTYYHDLHGITVRKYAEEPTCVFYITRNMYFSEIIRATGCTMEELKKHNPQYLNGYIPGKERRFALRLPVKYRKLFADNIDTVDA